MPNVLIYRGDRPSASAFALKNALRSIGFNVKVNRLSDSYRQPRPRVKILNWGVAGEARCDLNRPNSVATAVDKSRAFTVMGEAGVRIPEVATTLSSERRGKWLARTMLRSSGGEGIVVVRQGDTVPTAPLYVKYVPKNREYRLHVVRDKVVAVQQKRRESNVEQTDDQKLIRNRANGWVFCVDNVDPISEPAKEEAIAAVRALGLDFGAVDLIIGRDDGHAYVLEVNTAPGLESPTVLQAYAEALREVLNE